MKVIKHGKYYGHGPVYCDNCECEFLFYEEDVKERVLLYKIVDSEGEEIKRSTTKLPYVSCPECNNIILISNGENKLNYENY